ncbi:MAG: hypothetical protein OFPII_30430 [Osedax symbiont Rs1]|nr:MAG: hypothetical protein OFPII_30430 [Osedax symbiont Rs1]
MQRLTKKCPKPIAIPIVFVPGMMGSRLRRSDNKALIWDTKMAFLLSTWAGSTGVERRKLLFGKSNEFFNSKFLEVDPSSYREFKGNVQFGTIRTKLARGWGGVLWGSYGEFLKWLDSDLQRNLPDFPIDCSNIHFEVWAHPYNWTDSNENAALGITDNDDGPRVNGLTDVVATAFAETTAKYQDVKDIKILKPIVITHSMGGLVARAYSVLGDGQDKVHTVIHGAMPTHGAPVAYKRMRGGFGGATETILGADAAEVTPMLANSPGGLQLLPNQYHKNKEGEKEWLKVTVETEGDIQNLPRSNPYEEIYGLRNSWLRLTNPEYINPLNPDIEGIWLDYIINLDIAQKFHGDLGEQGFHEPTNMFYCASKDQPSYDRIEWKAANVHKMSEKNKQIAKQLLSKRDLPLHDDGNGNLRFLLSQPEDLDKLEYLKDMDHLDRLDHLIQMAEMGSTMNNTEVDTLEVRLQGPNSAGDGTVHTGSGIDLSFPYTITSDSITKGKDEKEVAFSHQDAFTNTEVRKKIAKWISEIIVEETKN